MFYVELLDSSMAKMNRFWAASTQFRSLFRDHPYIWRN